MNRGLGYVGSRWMTTVRSRICSLDFGETAWWAPINLEALAPRSVAQNQSRPRIVNIDNARLERAVDRNAKVIGLLFGELRQFDADLLQVQTRDFFVEFFRQDVNADL